MVGATRSIVIAALASAPALLLAWPGAARAQSTPPPLITSERGLREPVPPVPNPVVLNPQEAADVAAGHNARVLPTCAGRWTASGTAVTFQGSFIFGPGPLPGKCADTSVGGAGGTNTFFAPSSLEHRVFLTEVASLIDNRNSTNSDVELTGALANGAQVTLRGATVADARSGLLRSARNADGRRYFGGVEVRTGGGPVVVTDRVLSELVTGRDTYATAVSQIGPGTATAGTRTNCPAPASAAGCTGGITVEAPAGTQLFVAEIYTTLFITTFVERTLTGGTTFYNVALTPLPTGAVHAAMSNAGLLIGDRFLRRLTDGSADRAGFWSEAWGARANFDGVGALGATDIDSFGFAGGFVLRPGEHWTLGFAGEYGESDLSIADALTPESADASHLKIGAHAAFSSGRFHAGAAAMVGIFDVETTGSSALGAARADYEATIAGVGVDAGYDIPVGDLTLTPNVGASVLWWSRDGFAEAGGPAPLTVADASDRQTRLWAGLTARWAPDASRVSVSGHARAVAIAGDRMPRVTTFDPQLPNVPFVVAGPDFGDSAAELGLALNFRLSPRATLAAGYDGRFGGGYDSHGGFVNLTVSW